MSSTLAPRQVSGSEALSAAINKNASRKAEPDSVSPVAGRDSRPQVRLPPSSSTGHVPPGSVHDNGFAAVYPYRLSVVGIIALPVLESRLVNRADVGSYHRARM